MYFSANFAFDKVAYILQKPQNKMKNIIIALVIISILSCEKEEKNTEIDLANNSEQIELEKVELTPKILNGVSTKIEVFKKGILLFVTVSKDSGNYKYEKPINQIDTLTIIIWSKQEQYVNVKFWYVIDSKRYAKTYKSEGVYQIIIK